ncbi:hypothetical protein [Streptomyces sp. YS-3]|uniref:hypothetical protein n=1 Tax=Streptomyces sp. YS-3 TaxID=3381352 RepID=UPI00386287D6
MRRSDLLTLLITHTGDLRPGDGSTHAELTDLRRAVLTAAPNAVPDGHRSSDSVPDGHRSSQPAPDEALRQELEYLVESHIAGNTAAQPGLRLWRRGTPGDGGTPPDWAVAMRPERTFGPFLDSEGRRVWYDLFHAAERWFTVRFGSGGPVLLALPWEPRPDERDPLTADIPAGTVWISAGRLDPAAPADAWAGLRITSGTFAVRGPAHYEPGELVLDRGSRIGLGLEPDPTTVPGPEAGPGAEAARCVFEPPATAGFVLDPEGAATVGELTASLTVYGTRVVLRRPSTAIARPKYSAEGQCVLVPLMAAPAHFPVTDTRAELFTPSGAADIRRADWRLPVTTVPGSELGEAKGAGALHLGLGEGLSAVWRGLEGGPARLGAVDVLLDGGSLKFTASGVDARRCHQTCRLWQDSQGRDAVVDVSFAASDELSYGSYFAGADTFQTAVTARTHLDRPRPAAGKPLDSTWKGLYATLHDGDGVALTLVAGAEDAHPDGGLQPMALALRNALLTVRPPEQLLLGGRFTVPGRLGAGALQLRFGLLQLVPMLPDPYAANFTPRPERRGGFDTQVWTRVAWSTPADAALTMKLATGLGTETDGVSGTLFPSPQSLPIASGQREDGDDLLKYYEDRVRGQRHSGLTLLDVSSAADQLGVGLALEGDEFIPVSLDSLALHTTAAKTCVLLLPQFQWEPVHNLPNHLTGDTDRMLTCDTDGGPTLIASNSVTLVPVAPVEVASEIVRAYAEGDTGSNGNSNQEGRGAGVLFTLPFGLKAVVELNPCDHRYEIKPSLLLFQAQFDGLGGERQLSLRAGSLPASREEGAPPRPPQLDGRTVQTITYPGPTSSVLGTELFRDTFNGLFQQQVPLSRIDFGGYGATLFSRWVNERPEDVVYISQVAFDAFHGRTAYERIQLTSILEPCDAVVVRIITLERHGSGTVVRWDSGWLATTPGLFRNPYVDHVVHPGVVHGMFDIREIRDTDHHVILSKDGSGATPDMQAVYYDADIEIEGVQQGQGPGGRVPARRQLGFVQCIKFDPKTPVSELGVGALTPEQLQQLFDIAGPIGGPVDCTVRVGDSPHTMRVTGVYAHNAGKADPSGTTGKPEFAVAVHGSPNLPGAGQWSVVRTDAGIEAKSVAPVDAGLGVPLIRRNVEPDVAYPLRWADAADLFTSGSRYVLLFAGETGRILYPCPQVEHGQTEISSTANPLLADAYCMLRTTGLFPSLDESIPFDAPYPLSVASGQLRFDPEKVVFKRKGNDLERRLVEGVGWRADAVYDKGKEFVVDTANGWTVDVPRIAQNFTVEPFGEVLSVIHDLHSPAVGPTDFPAPEVHPGGALQDVADVLDLLNNLVPGTNDAGEDVPGLPGSLHVTASLSGTAFRLDAGADFRLEGPDGEGVDCGVGKVRGALSLGADLTADLLAAKTGGSVLFEVTGSYQQLIFPAVYAGGQLRFSIRGDASGKAAVEMEACAAGSVGGTLIPLLIDLEAGVQYGYFIGVTEQHRYRPGAVLGLSGRAMLLSGLLGFSFSTEGRLIINRVSFDPAHPENAEVRLRGDILVAGTVTVAWAVKKRKSFRTTYDVPLNWKAFGIAAKAGILPVP